MNESSLDEEMAKRHRKAIQVRSYKWQRVGNGVWTCTGPKQQRYRIRLSPPSCTCPDWDRIEKKGGVCKHYITSTEAETRYRSHLVTKEGSNGQ